MAYVQAPAATINFTYTTTQSNHSVHSNQTTRRSRTGMDRSSFSTSEDSATVEVANECRSQEESWKKEATRIRKQQKKIKAAVEDSRRIRQDFTLTTREDTVVLSNETFVAVREIRERSRMTREETGLMKADLVLLYGRVEKVRKDVQQMKMERKGVKGSTESFEVRLDGILRRLVCLQAENSKLMDALRCLNVDSENRDIAQLAKLKDCGITSS